MRVSIAYGRGELEIDLPDDVPVQVITPAETPGLPDERAALLEAMRHPIGCPPLREIIPAGAQVAVVFSDITRPMPNDRVLPVLLEEIESARPGGVILINALGTHRPNSPEELERMLGKEVISRYRIIQHDPFAEGELKYLGESSFGHPLWVNRTFAEADVRILTGFIEPHMFAGFSGGPKAVLPGIAGERTILLNHSAPMLNHPRATWGVTRGNPIWEEMLEMAVLANPDFLLNVTLNARREITGVFAGALRPAHARGVAFAREHAMVPVDGRFDIVITSNAGYPLDMNVYQAVKGMSVAAEVVKPGGHIIVAAECWDGVPDHGEYKRLLHAGRDPAHLLEMMSRPDFLVRDQWEVAIQARVQVMAHVYLKCSYLSDEEVRKIHLTPCHDIGELVRELVRELESPRICVLPQGPLVVPYLAESETSHAVEEVEP
ncbi:MAG: nickel-dependent lactate racemase [Anaerolineae bacterium]